MPSQQNVVVKASGLHTNNNYFSSTPAGSMSVATNVVIDRSEVVEPRRGFVQYATLSGFAKQLINYKDRVLANIGTQLQYDDGTGIMAAFSGLSAMQTNGRIKAMESNGNLYFTTDDGIKKISAASADDFLTSPIEYAGGVKAVDLTVVPDYSQFGWLEPSNSAAYRLVFGRKDNNTNLILGAVSSRAVVTNLSTNACVSELNFTLPSNILENDFYQIYRTGISAVSTSDNTGDEMYLVIEDTITSTDIAATEITVQDITSESFRERGALLYTNPVSGEGITQSNESPPFAKDICLYKGFTFLANTKTVQRLNLDFLTINGIVDNVTNFQVSDGASTNTYTFQGDFETATADFSALTLHDNFVNVYNKQATATVTINTYSALAGDTITVNGTVLTEGTDWSAVTSNNVTATNLATTINALPLVSAVAVGAVVTITADLTGTGGNAYTLATSDAVNTTISGALFTGGVNEMVGPAQYFTLTSAMDERIFYVWFKQSTADTDPAPSGMIGIQVNVALADTPTMILDNAITEIYAITGDFNITRATSILTVECSNNGAVTTASTNGNMLTAVVTTDANGTGEDIAGNKAFLPRTTGLNAPNVSVQLEQVAKSLIKVLNKKDDIINAYYASGFDDVDGKMTFEQKLITGPAFYINSNLGTIFNPTVLSTGNAVISSNEISPNRIYYSKYFQPDAVPLTNYIDVGQKDREIKRIIALRDSLFILKENGIYKLTGDAASSGGNNFTIQEFDFSAKVLAPDTAVVLNNTIYALSTQGVCTISDTGVAIISRPIEDQILSIIKSNTDYKELSFGIAYESDRSYHLHTVTRAADTVCTQVFRYNNFTNNWTKLDLSKTCGIVNFGDDKMYLGAGDIAIIEKERKSLNRTDHADREYPVTVKLNGVSGSPNLVNITSIENASIGDVFLQRQFLVLEDFNRLLQRLDADLYVADTNYYSTLMLNRGENVRSRLLDLASKLDTDTGITGTNYYDLVDDYAQTATAIAVGDEAVLTFPTNNIQAGRMVIVQSADSQPAINGIFEVIDSDSTTITLDKQVLVAGTTATVQTLTNYSQDIQACFNFIVDALNADAGVFYANYTASEGFIDYESIILGVDTQNSILTVNANQNYMYGDAYILNAIESTVIYNPQFMGDPTIEKQFSEGTFMFQDGNFSAVTISYASDKSPSYVEIPFVRDGNGDFGVFSFGTGNFGGLAAPIPLRTYIPLDKQRGRFLSIKFSHKIALEEYSLFGVSLKFRPYASRSYR